jgi:hypothetical protein
MPRFSLRSLIAFVAVISLLLFLGTIFFNYFAYGRGRVWFPSSWPSYLRILREDSPSEIADSISSIRVYRLEGFLDESFVWRLRTSPETIDYLRNRFKLVVVDPKDVPDNFWSKGPRWWNPKEGQDAIFLSSRGFSANDRGAEGDYLFAMYDRDSRLLYAWSKHNF